MIAAIDARKSTEQNGVSDDQKSMTRQIEHATAYARTKGFRAKSQGSKEGTMGRTSSCAALVIPPASFRSISIADAFNAANPNAAAVTTTYKAQTR
jgi:hypothetical protein